MGRRRLSLTGAAAAARAELHACSRILGCVSKADCRARLLVLGSVVALLAVSCHCTQMAGAIDGEGCAKKIGGTRIASFLQDVPQRPR